MFKKGDMLKIEHPDHMGSFDTLVFTEDARSIGSSGLKYMGAAMTACDDYKAAGKEMRKIICQSCRYQCPKRKYMVKYVGAFGESAVTEIADGTVRRTCNPELEALLAQEKKEKRGGLRKGLAARFAGAGWMDAVDGDGRSEGAADRIAVDRRVLARERALIQHQASVKIVSPFIMRTFTSGGGYCGDVAIDYVVLEYVDGSSLHSHIAVLNNMEDRREADRRRFDMIRQLLLGVRAYARQYSLVYNVHRDLKPENMMVITDGEDGGRQQLKLLDFDMLIAQDNLAGDQLYLGGTVGYVHPEAYRIANLPEDMLRQFSHRWDLYAVGLIMYEIMEGHPHFEDEVYLVDEKEAYSLKPMNSAGDYPELEHMIQKLIARDNGYQDIDSVIWDYEAFLEKYYCETCYESFYLPHFLECRPGYETNLPFANVYCRVTSDGLKPCWQSFIVYKRAVTNLIYGGNIMGCQCVKEDAGRKAIGAFYYYSVDDDDVRENYVRFIPLCGDCLPQQEDDIFPGQRITYRDVELQIEEIYYYT